jgi:hypothetical protein
VASRGCRRWRETVFWLPARKAIGKLDSGGRGRGHVLFQDFHVALRCRATTILFVEKGADCDVVNAAKLFGELKSGNRGGTYQPFGAQNHWGDIGPLHISGDFGPDLGGAGRDADVRPAPRLGKAQARSGLISEENSDGANRALPQTQIVGAEIERHALRVVDLGAGLFGSGQIAPAGQQGSG